MATKKKSVKKQKSLLAKKKARLLAAKKAERQKKALFKKRSLAAKKGWVTRRGIAHTRKGRDKLLSTIKELEARLVEAEGYTQQYLSRYKQEIAMDNLPPRMIHETAVEHAGRIVKALKMRGYNQDQAYAEVAAHTGLAPREVYSLFLYVGPGEYVA
jgi:hypothetical protein